jgi:hypothetical protein
MASPLTLIMPLVPGTTFVEISTVIAEFSSSIGNALSTLQTVHYARVLLLDASNPNLQPRLNSNGKFSMAIITEYDGDFDAYIQDFVKAIGAPFFDALLPMVVGGDAFVPIMDHIPAFQKYIAHNDASQHVPNSLGGNNGLYEAYPYTVPVILASCGP